uniref:Uncharacterized protein n=1 Tax=Anguilla anguilla TaxID=7936 RepID=A0A0E9PE86_ANGAN
MFHIHPEINGYFSKTNFREVEKKPLQMDFQSLCAGI